MKIEEKLGFLGGGRMAEALIRGLLKAGLVGTDRIIAVDPAAERRQFLSDKFKVETAAEAAALADCGIVILAVKPQLLAAILSEEKEHFNEGQLVISIAAGVAIKSIENSLPGRGCRLVRVMPNTPALVMEGASALCAGPGTSDADMVKARMIFDAVGKTVVLREAELDAVTGLSGSGPAYVFSFIEALIDGGVKVGLTRPVAETLALQTVLGATRLAISTGEHPANLRAMVTSPGGTTIAGLHEMEKAGFQGIVMDAIEAATRRSRELGKMAGDGEGDS